MNFQAKRFFLMSFLSLLVHTNSLQATNSCTETLIETEIQRPTMSWKQVASIPAHFITSLFEPFTDQDAQTFYNNQLQQIKSNPSGYMIDTIFAVGRAVKDHPLDAVSFLAGAVVGHTNLGEVPAISNLNKAITIAKFTKEGTRAVLALQLTSGDTLVKKGMQIAVIGTTLYFISSVPGADAVEFKSLLDAKKHYSGKTCENQPWGKLMTPASECLHAGKGLQECRALITDQTTSDLYVFTRHPSTQGIDPVSITKLHDGKTCFYTALEANAPVTETCFDDLTNLDSRTVSVVPEMKLTKAHEGLNPGQSVRHIGLHLKKPTYSSKSCGTFHEHKADYELGEEPSCLLTAIHSQGDVSQMCFDPNHPESLTLKKAEGVELQFQDDGKPVSVVFKNAKKHGLNVDPDQKVEAEVCPDKPQSISLWDAFSWWWNQKTPCDSTPQKQEL
ncbi:MAG: hypothetical protein BGO76_03810 [Caedibacter sp. 38-128]|nr:hypothetical protein [Holosporales bacterium]OJX07983.1 MAG: hypothetical protein BGO76_03810 [Caedibacter sp. 38-128]